MKIDKKIKSSLTLILNEDYVQALKVIFDALYEDVFTLEKKINGRTSIDSKTLKKNKMEYFNKLLNYLNEKNVCEYEMFFKDIVALIIYFDEEFDEQVFNDNLRSRIKTLTLNLINIIQKNIETDKSYYICKYNDTLLNNRELFDEEDIIPFIIDYYYTIQINFYKLYKANIWNEIDTINEYDIFTVEELNILINTKEIIESNLFNICVEEQMKLKDDLEQSIEVEYILYKIRNAYNAKFIMNELQKFKNYDGTIDKNTYGRDNIKGRREDIFHQNIYPYLCKNISDSIILSEISTGGERYDLYYYNMKREMSVLIELKVNTLDDIKNNIDQLKGYLDRVEKKHSIFMQEPSFGILLIYNIGNIELKEKYEQIKDQISSSRLIDNIITITNLSKPIFIFVLDGKN